MESKTVLVAKREGNMEKRGSIITSWRTRYFILYDRKGGLLFYFLSKHDAIQGKILGVIAIRNGSIRKCDLFKKQKQKMYAFELFSPTQQRIWFLNCSSESERDAWMQSLSELTSSVTKRIYSVPVPINGIKITDLIEPKQKEEIQEPEGEIEEEPLGSISLPKLSPSQKANLQEKVLDLDSDKFETWLASELKRTTSKKALKDKSLREEVFENVENGSNRRRSRALARNSKDVTKYENLQELVSPGDPTDIYTIEPTTKPDVLFATEKTSGSKALIRKALVTDSNKGNIRKLLISAKVYNLPTIINTIGSYLKGIEIWIAEEFYPLSALSINLKEYDGPIEEALAVIAFIAKEVLTALSFLHSYNIVHGRLKRRNIKITKDQVKVKKPLQATLEFAKEEDAELEGEDSPFDDILELGTVVSEMTSGLPASKDLTDFILYLYNPIILCCFLIL